MPSFRGSSELEPELSAAAASIAQRRGVVQLPEALPYLWSNDAKIHPASILGLQGPHYLSHVPDRTGARLGNCRLHCSFRLDPIKLLWQEFLDDRDFRAFPFGQFHTPAFLVGTHRFLALLHHLAEYFEDALGVDTEIRSISSLGPPSDVAILDGGGDQPKRREPDRFPFAHGLLQCGIDPLPEFHLEPHVPWQVTRLPHPCLHCNKRHDT